MNDTSTNRQLISRLMFRLLPAQIFLCVINSVNSVVSGLFASNFLGPMSMSAVGLYLPLNMLINAISTMLLGGATIMCGKCMGENASLKIRSIFSLDLLSTLFISLILMISYGLFSFFDLTRFFIASHELRQNFNLYLLGQALGVFPLIAGGQLSSFLSLENKTKRTTAATIFCIILSLFFDFLLVSKLGMGVLGLSLASSLGMWAFFLIQAHYYIFLESKIGFWLSVRHLQLPLLYEIVKIGSPGAVNFGYQTVRGVILTGLILRYAGSDGLSAFATVDSFLRFFWAVPFGMVSVSRILFSVSVGEEDRNTIKDIILNIIIRFIPFTAIISILISSMAGPITLLYYKDTSSPVFLMTEAGLRILPLAMPLSVFTLNYSCFKQAIGDLINVHILSFLTGVFLIVMFSAILIPFYGMNGIFAAHVISGIALTLVIVIVSFIKKKGISFTLDDLIGFPPDFGISQDEYIHININNMELAVGVSEKLHNFCLKKGISRRKAYFSALATEEMAAIIIENGFYRDSKKHTIDIRITKKENDLLIRIKDNCQSFNYIDRLNSINSNDMFSGIGIRIVSGISMDMQYQSILGLNVLTLTL